MWLHPRGKHHNKTATKTTTSLYLSKNIIKKAKKHGLNLSKFTEQALTSVLDLIETHLHTGHGISVTKGCQQGLEVVPGGSDLNRQPLEISPDNGHLKSDFLLSRRVNVTKHAYKD